MVKKILISLLIIGFFFPLLSLAGDAELKLPETMEEGKEMLEERGMEAVNKVPEVVKKTWDEEAVPVWRKMWNWTKNTWNNYAKGSFNKLWYDNLKPRIQNSLQKIKKALGMEVEERKEMIKGEWEKEKEEMKKEMEKEMPTTGRSLWERFKELFK